MTSATLPVHARTTVRDLLGSVDRSFVVLAVASRLPTAMLPLGLLLLVAGRTGSYATGGLAVAALSLGGGVGGPLVGLAADRVGQRLVAVSGTLAQAAALVALLLVEDLAVVLVLAAVLGWSNPQVGAMARARWAAAGRRRQDRAAWSATAMAWEGAVDETSFVLGPVLVGTVAGTVSPTAALVLALLVALTAQTGFGLHRTALPGHGHRRGRPVTAERAPRRHLGWLLLATAAVGLVFGATQTGVAARLAEAGQDALAGPVYAFLGVGSGVAGLLAGRLPASVSLASRISWGGAGLVLAGLLAAVAPVPVALAAACLLLGLCLGPALVSGYALAERATPLGRGTSTMTALGTANVVGVAVGAAAAGTLVDALAPGAALLVAALAGLLVAVGGVGAGVTRPGR